MILEASLTGASGKVFAGSTEKDGGAFKVKSFKGGKNDGSFHILTLPYYLEGRAPKGFKTHSTANNAFNQMAITKQNNFIVKSILAVFPIPEDKLLSQTKLAFNIVNGSETLTNINGATPLAFTERFGNGSFAKQITANSSIDATFLIIEDDFPVAENVTSLNVYGRGDVEGYSGGTARQAHFINPIKDNSLENLLAAHELIHQDRFLSSGHNSTKIVEDGWDAGARKGSSVSTSGMKSLKIETDDASWIHVDEYRKLLDVLVINGKDPVIFQIFGLIDIQTLEHQLSSDIYMGLAFPNQAESDINASLLAYDIDSNLINSNSVPLTIPYHITESENTQIVDNFKNSLFFYSNFELPENVSLIEVRLDNQIIYQEFISANAPEISWGNISYEQNDNQIQVKITISDVDNDEVMTQWLYSANNVDFNPIAPQDVTKLDETTYLIDSAELAGSSQAKLQVWATGGNRLSTSTSPTLSFTLADQVPTIQLVENNSLTLGRSYEAIANDAEDIQSLNFHWALEDGTSLQSGTLSNLLTLPEFSSAGGNLSVTVTDSKNQSATDSLTIRPFQQSIYDLNSDRLHIPAFTIDSGATLYAADLILSATESLQILTLQSFDDSILPAVFQVPNYVSSTASMELPVDYYLDGELKSINLTISLITNSNPLSFSFEIK